MKRVTVTLTKSAVNEPHVPIPQRFRRLFPGYEVEFSLETSHGEIKTYMTSGKKDSKKGSQDGKYFAHGISQLFQKLGIKRPGKKLVIEIVKPMKVYKLLDAIGKPKENEAPDNATERYFIEGEKRAVNAIARSPKLRAEAKKHYGLKCACCGFDFEQFYGKTCQGGGDCAPFAGFYRHQRRAPHNEN